MSNRAKQNPIWQKNASDWEFCHSWVYLWWHPWRKSNTTLKIVSVLCLLDMLIYLTVRFKFLLDNHIFSEVLGKNNSSWICSFHKRSRLTIPLKICFQNCFIILKNNVIIDKLYNRYEYYGLFPSYFAMSVVLDFSLSKQIFKNLKN